MERAICDSIRSICEAAEVSKIVSITRRGNTAKLISRLRLQPEIIALTANERTFREMHLYYGVMPVMCDLVPGPITTAQAGMYLFRQGLLREEDWVLFVSGEFQPQSYTTNTIQVIRMGELADYCNQNGSLCE
jgi:pyruvate kinase